MKTNNFIIIMVLSIFLSCGEDTKNEIKADIDTNDLAIAELIQIFPKTHSLNKNISKAFVDANSDSILSKIGLDSCLHADFGSGLSDDAPIGIPYIIVGKNQAKLEIKYTKYKTQSDTGKFPIPLDAPIENNGKGNAHVISIDINNGILYELFKAKSEKDKWSAASGARFDLKSDKFRRAGWISADFAGLPVFPCLVRYPEVEKGEIDHAIRFTLPRKQIYGGYVHPARHALRGNKNKYLLPFGAKLRLKADFDISGFSKNNRVILRALKKYGLILADIGLPMHISGAPNEAWDNDDLKELQRVKVSDFEVIKLGKIK